MDRVTTALDYVCVCVCVCVCTTAHVPLSMEICVSVSEISFDQYLLSQFLYTMIIDCRSFQFDLDIVTKLLKLAEPYQK